LNRHPTIFHVTHPKAGSQWVRFFLYECEPERVVEAEIKVAHFFKKPIIPGSIYPALYVPYPRFEETLKPQLSAGWEGGKPSPDDDAKTHNWYNFVLNGQPIIKFVVIRDIRDALVSLYFSLKISHELISENVAEGHRKLNELSFEDGFLDILRTRGMNFANIQRSWLPACENGEALLVRYEDLLADEHGMFAKILEYCQIDITASELSELVRINSFENKSGRTRGEENVESHFRKGISGDWKNHFTEKIKAECKELYGSLLIATGYEKDMNW